MKFSTKHLNGERRIINGVKVLILKTGEPKYQPKQKNTFKKNLHDYKKKL
jgi:hypothetical protein